MVAGERFVCRYFDLRAPGCEPITFELDGEQYVATPAGIGGVSMAGGLAGGAQQCSEFGRAVAFKIAASRSSSTAFAQRRGWWILIHALGGGC